MTTRIKIKKGAGTPSGLTFGELAYDVTNKKLFIGITGGNALLANTDGGVATFNGLTGAVGITAGNQISLTQNGNIFSINVIEGSTSGLDADTLRGVSGQRFIENLQTGLLYGGLISVNAGNTAQVNITAGAGIVVSPGASLTAYPIPTVTPVTWAAKTGVTLAGLTSSDETWLAIDSSGNLVQTNVAFTDAQYSSQIPLGAALHLSRTYIQLVKVYPHVSYGQPEQFDPFIRAFGNLKLSGHEISANGANLNVNRSAGKAYALGRNYSNDPNNPNIVTDTSAAPATGIYRFYRNGSGAFTYVINSAIDPTKYDNGTGTLATTTSAKFTIQRIFYLPNEPSLLGVYYGRQEYNSISDAQANIPFEPFSESDNTATQGIFCGWLIVQGNCTALNDTADAKFINAGLFRNTSNIGGGGLAIASIDDLSDVTTTTPSNNQVLRWNSGTAQWVNSDVNTLPLVSSFNGLTGAVTGVSTFNGLTGAVTGVTVGGTNVFTSLNSFNAGISAAGGVTLAGTFSGATGSFSRLLTASAGISASNITTDYLVVAAGSTFGAAVDHIFGLSNRGLKINAGKGNSEILTYGNDDLSVNALGGNGTLNLFGGNVTVGDDGNNNGTQIIVDDATSQSISYTAANGHVFNGVGSFSELLTASAGISAAGATFSGVISTPSTAIQSRVPAGTGVTPTVQIICPSADFNLLNQTATQAVFNTPQDTITLQASTTYMFEGLYLLSTGTTSHSTAMSFVLTTATMTNCTWITHTSPNTALNAPAAGIATAIFNSVAGGNCNSVTVNQYLMIRFQGMMRVNAGGTLVPNIAFSAAPGGTNTTLVGSYLKFYPIGSNTIDKVGTAIG
jgi:hypothetical protein